MSSPLSHCFASYIGVIFTDVYSLRTWSSSILLDFVYSTSCRALFCLGSCQLKVLLEDFIYTLSATSLCTLFRCNEGIRSSFLLLPFRSVISRFLDSWDLFLGHILPLLTASSLSGDFISCWSLSYFWFRLRVTFWLFSCTLACFRYAYAWVFLLTPYLVGVTSIPLLSYGSFRSYWPPSEIRLWPISL